MTKTLLTLLALATIPLALFAPHLLDGGVLFPVAPSIAPPWHNPLRPTPSLQDLSGTDKAVFTYPNLVRWTDSIFDSPRDLLWNPWNFCGTPFLATLNTAVLYPPNLVFRIFGVLPGFLPHALLHVFLSALFVALCLREIGRSRSAALLGGLVYSGSGWFAARHDTIQFIQSATWIPLILLGVLLCARLRLKSGVLLSAFGTALSFLGGMPQITVFGLLTAGLVVMFRAALALKTRQFKSGAKGLSFAGLGIALGLLLVGLQLFPTLEQASRSGRRTQSVAALKAHALHPVELVGFVAPELLGTAAELHRWQRERPGVVRPGTTEQSFPFARQFHLGTSGATATEGMFFSGVAALVLALIALFSRWNGATGFGTLLLSLGLLGALGTPVLDLLLALPGFDFANPRRLVFFIPAGMAILAAVGCDRVLQDGVTLRGRFVSVSLALLLVVLWGVGTLFPSFLADCLDRVPAVDKHETTLGTWWNVKLLPAALAGLGVAMVTGWLRPRWLRFAGLFGILLLELAFLNRHENPLQDASTAFHATRTVEFLKARCAISEKQSSAPLETGARFLRFRSKATDAPEAASLPVPLPPNLALPFRLFDVQGYEALIDRRLEEFFECIEPGITLEHHLVQELRQRASLDSPLLDLLSVGYILSPGLLNLPLAYGDIDELCGVFENSGALSRLQMPQRIRVLDSDAVVLKELARATFDPKAVAFVTMADAGKHALAIENQGPATSAQATFLDYRPSEVKIAAESPSDFCLLVADTYADGWVARIDGGTEVPLIRANHILRMILVPKGKHVITMRYEPKSLRNGGLISLAGLALLGAVLAALSFRRPHQSRGESLSHA